MTYEKDRVALTGGRFTRLLEEKYDLETQASAYTITSPIPPKIMSRSMPVKYKTPNFKLFEGSGNATEHMHHFTMSLNEYAQDETVCMREFVKTLTGDAFTWYISLKPNSIRSWMRCDRRLWRSFTPSL